MGGEACEVRVVLEMLARAWPKSEGCAKALKRRVPRCVSSSQVSSESAHRIARRLSVGRGEAASRTGSVACANMRTDLDIEGCGDGLVVVAVGAVVEVSDTGYNETLRLFFRKFARAIPFKVASLPSRQSHWQTSLALLSPDA